jgi:hypothetical protein
MKTEPNGHASERCTPATKGAFAAGQELSPQSGRSCGKLTMTHAYVAAFGERRVDPRSTILECHSNLGGDDCTAPPAVASMHVLATSSALTEACEGEDRLRR